ncbi:MAG: roadblock/LC7 domain-containing protein [Candidatus Firestonebacteria bacterium]|nr:roadblock/LC7 domain-containing protein [Candidatus Firestonebacteria bacterium]
MSMVLYEKELKDISECLHNLLAGAKAKCVFLVDKSGQLITSSGDTSEIDSISLASLTAGNFAATSALAQLMGENEFSLLFHQGEKDNIHISVVESRVILVVIFDDKTSLGLIRLRVKNAIVILSDIFVRIFEKVKKEKEQSKTGTLRPLEEPHEEKVKTEKMQQEKVHTESNISATKASENESQKETPATVEEQKQSSQDERFGEDFQKKAASEIDNLFMD